MEKLNLKDYKTEEEYIAQARTFLKTVRESKDYERGSLEREFVKFLERNNYKFVAGTTVNRDGNKFLSTYAIHYEFVDLLKGIAQSINTDPVYDIIQKGMNEGFEKLNLPHDSAFIYYNALSNLRRSLNEEVDWLKSQERNFVPTKASVYVKRIDKTMKDNVRQNEFSLRFTSQIKDRYFKDVPTTYVKEDKSL